MVIGDGENLEAFLALAEAIDEPVFVWDPNGAMLWTNAAFVRETGMTVEDFAFQNPDNPFIHPDDLQQVLADLAAFMASDAKRSAPIQNRFIDIWGRVRSLTSIVSKIVWRGGPALLLASRIATSPESLSEADASYRRFVESAEDGIVKLSQSGRIVYSNRRFHEMVAMTPAALGKLRFPELLYEADRRLGENALERLLAAERVTFEARLISADQERWVAVNASPLGDVENVDGAATFLLVVRDVSEARRLEEKMRQAQKLESLGTLAGGMAHDSNNIVTSVLANATLAESMIEPESALVEVLRDIRVAGERAAALNASLLAYVGQAPTRAELLELNRLAGETVRMVAPLISKSVHVEFVPAPVEPVVRGDPGQLSQVLVNLLTNAAQSLGEKSGRVELTLRRESIVGVPSGKWLPVVPAPGDYVAVCVTDDGEGMSAAVVERIFDPFFTTKGLGRGLGLSATLGIVRRHGGALRIQSEVGRGTRFEVLIPFSEGAVVEAPRKVVVNEEVAQTGVVLFVDDEELIRHLGRRILERAGYQVVLAASGEQALDLLAQDSARFSVLVVDHSLPGVRGDVVAARAKDLQRDLAVVKASGYRDVFDTKEDVGTSVFLPKPYTRADLLRSVQEAIFRVRAQAV